MNTEWKGRQWVGGVNQPDEKIKLFNVVSFADRGQEGSNLFGNSHV